MEDAGGVWVRRSHRDRAAGSDEEGSQELNTTQVVKRWRCVWCHPCTLLSLAAAVLWLLTAATNRICHTHRKDLSAHCTGSAGETDAGVCQCSPVQCDVWFGKKKLLAATRTVTSHVNNMILGTTTGFRYTMRFVYAHFPINANIPNDGKKVRTRRL